MRPPDVRRGPGADPDLHRTSTNRQDAAHTDSVNADEPARRCPDCSAPNDATGVRHDDTCPVAVAAEATAGSDREFFASHPAAPHYWRPVTWDEGVTLRLAGALPDVPGTVVGRVQVVRIAEGVRLRRFGAVVLVPASGGDR